MGSSGPSLGQTGVIGCILEPRPKGGVPMAPPNPKRPPRPRNPPDDNETSDEGELPFDERDATPLRADDPKPQRVTTYPALRAGRSRSRSRDTALAGGFATASLAAPDSSEVFLYAERGPGAGQLLPIAPGTLVLGRSSSADLRLPHASISRRHARLQRRGERFFLEDLGARTAPTSTRSASARSARCCLDSASTLARPC